jgi:7,8-dihydropterin-6-yl-methyl-4-(beta-D-ribofuranosyl)aminobenzene 5'-phosphate synthase
MEYFGETPEATLTVLVDNRADLIVESTDSIRYYTKGPLLAEHGFAVMIHLASAKLRILWDAGITSTALIENMKSMELDEVNIDAIAISHGHFDHTAGVTAVLRGTDVTPMPKLWDKDAADEEILGWVKGRRIPLVIHPAAFRERWSIRKDGTRYGPVPPPPREEWEAAGAQIIPSDKPHRLGPGCWTTGEIPRLSFEDSGPSPARVYRDGSRFVPDAIDDDQAIVINLKGKGLVVLSGCAHSGIVNTVNHAREISGVDKIHAILGGFHLAGASDERIQRTIDEIKKCTPAIVVPSHCTGFRATCQFAAQMPEETKIGVVGATYCF